MARKMMPGKCQELTANYSKEAVKKRKPETKSIDSYRKLVNIE